MFAIILVYVWQSCALEKCSIVTGFADAGARSDDKTLASRFLAGVALIIWVVGVFSASFSEVAGSDFELAFGFLAGAGAVGGTSRANFPGFFD
jgi:hypothetical protein